MSRRLLAGYLALTLAVLVSLELPLAIVNAHNERQDLIAKIERDAFAVSALSEDALQTGRGLSNLAVVAARYRATTGGRVVIVDARGRSVADSQPARPGERAFASRPEVAAALRGTTVSGIRRSATLHDRLLYVAVPVSSSGVVFGAVRITYPTSTLDRRIRRYRVALGAVALLVLAGATGVGLLLARSITRPLRRIEEAAALIGAGELAARAAEDDGPPEIRRLARVLNSSAARIAALVGAQEQFVADASHELRTPLTALRLRIENGQNEAALAEAERLGQLVDELLALARADGRGEPAEDIVLADVAVARIDVWSPLAAERGVSLAAQTAPGTVHASRGHVEQVLDNLLANALDASPDGATVTVTANGGELHVADQGAGLTAEERARAFDRFWRARSGPGSGLGLAIAKRLVELDGGEIELSEAAGGGIDAVVRYPISKP